MTGTWTSSVARIAASELDQRAGSEEPAQPKPWCERLAHRAPVGDAVRIERLENADRRPIEAQLGVVVVLDQQPTAPPRPGNRRCASLGMEDDTKGILMRRAEDDGRHLAPRQEIGARAVLVDGERDDLQPGRGSSLAMVRKARILHRDATSAVAPERAAEQREPVQEPGAHDDPLWIRRRAAGAAEVSRELRPELGATAWIAVAELVRGDVAETAAGRGRPGGARERGEIREPRMEAVTGALTGADGRGPRPRAPTARARRRASRSHAPRRDTPRR